MNTVELFVVMNEDGQFMRTKGYGGGGKSWVDTIEHAKIYTRIGPAKARVTYWKHHYPEYGCPKIVILEAKIKTILDQEERVTGIIKSIEKGKIKYKKMVTSIRKDEISRELVSLERELEEIG